MRTYASVSRRNFRPDSPAVQELVAWVAARDAGADIRDVGARFSWAPMNAHDRLQIVVGYGLLEIRNGRYFAKSSPAADAGETMPA